MSVQSLIRKSMQGAIEYYTQNPDKAVGQDAEAVAVIEAGLCARHWSEWSDPGLQHAKGAWRRGNRAQPSRLLPPAIPSPTWARCGGAS